MIIYTHSLNESLFFYFKEELTLKNVDNEVNETTLLIWLTNLNLFIKLKA